MRNSIRMKGVALAGSRVCILWGIVSYSKEPNNFKICGKENKGLEINFPREAYVSPGL